MSPKLGEANVLLLQFNKYGNSAKRYWSSLFDVFAASCLLITSMRVATEEFFLLCILADLLLLLC